jgi:flagella basal body P-ring formation protein FlgA
MILMLQLLAAAAGTACVEIPGERILARDLSGALPAFSQLPPELPLGFAPAPGARRVLTRLALDRLAAQHGLSLTSSSEICLERPMEALTRERVFATLRAALDIDPQASATGLKNARLELLDFSRYLVPRGQLEFPRSGLVALPSARSLAPVLWRGRVRYADGRSFPVWARVKISITADQVVAAQNLTAGRPIAAAQLRIQSVELNPFSERPASALDQVVGRLPRRSVPAGAPILPSSLAAPSQVERGDLVSVEVFSGAAQLSMQAQAQTAGNSGDLISLRNPATGQRFPARVDGERKAVIHANSQPQAIQPVPSVSSRVLQSGQKARQTGSALRDRPVH